MNVDDLGAGAHTPHDGWCDPNGLLWGFRRKAVELGYRDFRYMQEDHDLDSIRKDPRYRQLLRDEVARTILFLGSPDNKVTRGAVVPVYGQA